jgi:cephalosporin hydroxylase
MTNKAPAVLQFEQERAARLQQFQSDSVLKGATLAWSELAFTRGYSYNFEWMGRPIIQYPADMIGLQEVIWHTQPDLIIETGVAHGGSLVMYAGMQQMMGIENAKVLGVEIDLRAHNRELIQSHPMAKHIQIVDGSSVAEETLTQVRAIASQHKRIMVTLDSLHTHKHVLSELRAYAPLVTLGNYLIVQDTHVEELPDSLWQNRPWKRGDNPMTAALKFVAEDSAFVNDAALEAKLQITCARNGWLKRVRAS